jgi:hypothetical protein
MKYNMNEIEEAIMDAIILLDPPHGPRNDSNSRLSLSCIRQAHDILLSAASSITTIDHYRNHNSLYQGETPHRHGHEQVVSETVTTVADLYRSIVVSANLLLEVLQQEVPTRQREEDVRIHGSDEEDDKNAFTTVVIKNSSREQCIPSSPKTSKDSSTTCTKTWQQSSSSIRQMKSLHSTIIQSILLLKRLSHLSYMSNPKKYLDWHDDLLPKSRHSLLQECFQRKIMMDVEENVVFGLEDRLVSLNEDEYDSILAQLNSTNNEHESADTTFGSCNSNNNFETCLEDVKTFKEDSDDHDDDDDDDDDSDMLRCNEAESLEEIEMTWNAKELEKEESDLFDIALPGYNYPRNGGEKHAKKKKKKRMSTDQDDQVSYNYLSRAMIRQLEEIGLFHHVEVPFYGTPCIMKQGWLILRLEETINTNLITKNVETAKDGNLSERKDTKKCHVTLLANGVLLLEFHSDCETIKMDIIGNIKMFTVTAITRCTASPSNHTFCFHVNNVIECKNKNDEQSTKERSDKDQQKESFLSALLLGVDVEKGGSLMDGYRWMTVIEDCANFVSKVQEVKEDLLEQTWKKL